MSKKVRRAAPEQTLEKKPRGASLPNVGALQFKWRVDFADHEGPWGWELSDVPTLFSSVIPELHEFESMTWSQIDGPTGSHFVAVTDLSAGAQARLREIERDENEQLFFLSGYREERAFGVFVMSPS